MIHISSSYVTYILTSFSSKPHIVTHIYHDWIGLATFIGVGGIWNEGMDVSSFAGQKRYNVMFSDVNTQRQNDDSDDDDDDDSNDYDDDDDDCNNINDVIIW